jgi:hypothetical protein
MSQAPQIPLQTEADPSLPPPEPFTYDHIPKLGPAYEGDIRGSLLPRRGGITGYTYLYCPLTKKRAAELDGWKPLQNAATFTIVGPLGHIDVELMAQGTPIRGIKSSSNVRECFIDTLIWETTGLDKKTGFEPGYLPEETLISEPPGPTPVDPEKQALQAEIAELRQKLEDLQPPTQNSVENSKGETSNAQKPKPQTAPKKAAGK